MAESNIKSAKDGAPGVSGQTHRAYCFNGTNDGSENDDLSIQVPEGAEWFAIEGNANALAYEVHSAAAAGVEALDSRRLLAASGAMSLVPVQPGEFINISDQADTAVGAFVLIFEGGTSLPRGVAALAAAGLLSDPGA